MFAKPSASRGKANKVDGAPDKRQLQRTTKNQRKAGDMRRGGNYDLEDIGGLYGRGDEVEVAPREAKEEVAEESEEDEEESEEEEEAPEPARAEQRALVPKAGTAGLSPGDLEEVDEIEQGVAAQLREWARDPGLTEDEQRRLVRQLLAQWHPDKNKHIHEVATRVFQFIQAEVNKIIGELSSVASKEAEQEAKKAHRKEQRVAEKAATASALKAAREEKQRKKGKLPEEAPAAEEAPEAGMPKEAEWSLVIGHGPATTTFLRPWPRSHFSVVVSPLETRWNEILIFGGEAYDGRELTFYSDLYRLNLHSSEDEDRPLPWEKLYASVPLVPGPEARSSHQAVVWEKWLYIFGGEWSSRDQRRYRQFGDCWRFDVAGRPGTRWERVQMEKPPIARSGHRMASRGDGSALLYGGFMEDKRRRATYLGDCHVLDLQAGSWREAPLQRRARGPGKRSGHLLWMDDDAAFVYGGARPRKGGNDKLEALEDLWRAPAAGFSSSSAVAPEWEPVQAGGQGPGRRMGLCQCAVSQKLPAKRLVFGGVLDVALAEGGQTVGKPSKAGSSKELSLFMSDLFLLDCSLADAPVWSRLWPLPGTGPTTAPSLSALPPELLAKGGGADALALAVTGSAAPPTSGQKAPRGRMAAGCVVAEGSLWIFGGACESGPRTEVTLDDFWRIDLDVSDDGEVKCAPEWQCVLPLSERALVWFDSDSESDEEEMEMEEEPRNANAGIIAVPRETTGTLSKKQQKQEAKQARMEMKREKQQEKCEEKLDKKAAKKERQRQADMAKAGKS